MESERHPYNGRPYFCATCGLWFGEYMACEELDCALETTETALARAEEYWPSDPVEAIEKEMKRRGWKRRDLEPMLGSRGRVSEILNRKRPLSLTMIRALNAQMGIPTDVLVKEQSE